MAFRSYPKMAGRRSSRFRGSRRSGPKALGEAHLGLRRIDVICRRTSEPVDLPLSKPTAQKPKLSNYSDMLCRRNESADPAKPIDFPTNRARYVTIQLSRLQQGSTPPSNTHLCLTRKLRLSQKVVVRLNLRGRVVFNSVFTVLSSCRNVL